MTPHKKKTRTEPRKVFDSQKGTDEGIEEGVDSRTKPQKLNQIGKIGIAQL